MGVAVAVWRGAGDGMKGVGRFGGQSKVDGGGGVLSGHSSIAVVVGRLRAKVWRGGGDAMTGLGAEESGGRVAVVELGRKARERDLAGGCAVTAQISHKFCGARSRSSPQPRKLGGLPTFPR